MLQSKVQIVKEADFEMIKKFATTPYWEEKYSDLFTEDFHMDLPYAPPGMWQNMSHEETMYYFRWMGKTVSNPKYEEPIRALATDHEDIYWVFRNFEADVKWAGTEGVFKSRMPALVRVKDGKIAYIKEHADVAAYYKAIGIELPHFEYDAPDPSTITPRPAAPMIEHTPESLQRQVDATLNFFINPSYWDPEVNCVLADDFIHELCDAPADMPRVYQGTEYDAINEWLGKNMGDGGIYDCAFYNTNDPHIYVAEFNAYFDVTWGGCSTGGHYSNREISYIEINDQGLCTRLDEYFCTTSKFNSIGKSIPTFPQLF